MNCFIKKYIFIIMILGYSILTGFYKKPIIEYRGELGIDVISYSINWNTKEKLKTIYDELLNNVYGEEIKYLSKIIIYDGSPDNVSGYYNENIKNKKSHIEIFNGDKYNSVEEFARVLSHEYGHHFTFYYLVMKENKDYNNWMNTNYAKIRNLSKYNEVTYVGDENNNYKHKWDICEIAAEDYVQLFGSSLAKKSVIYYDTVDRLKRNIRKFCYHSNTFNLLPQENLEIPLATEVDGLYDYWIDFFHDEDIKKNYIEPIEDLGLKIEATYNVYKNFKQYMLTWNRPLKDDFFEYTIVVYPADDSSFPKPIKTVNTKDELCAYFGSAILDLNDGSANAILEKYVGDYIFQLFVKDSNNYIYSPNIVKVSFDDKGNVIQQQNVKNN